VSHYRDEWNPEAVHFPARLHVLALYGALATALMLTLVLTFLYQQPERMLEDLGLTLACGTALACLWPRRITTDEKGIRRIGLLRIGPRFIAWKDVRSVIETAEIPRLPRRLFGILPNNIVTVRGAKGVPPIRFTSRHSGRETFLHELKRWGVPRP
jgi:hypothetical protein